LFLLHDNAPAHRSVLVKDFLAKTNVTTLELPHNLPTWLQLIFFLFPRMKSVLNGRRICDVAEIIKNATEELKMISQNGFQKRFQHFYSCWRKCIFAQGDYFAGNVA
jgi:transposase